MVDVPDIDQLVHQLEVGDEAARRHVAETLARLGRPAVKPLLGILSHPDEAARRWAAWALGELGDSRALSPLGERLAVLHQADTTRTRLTMQKAIHKIQACTSGFVVEGELGPGRQVKPA